MLHELGSGEDAEHGEREDHERTSTRGYIQKCATGDRQGLAHAGADSESPIDVGEHAVRSGAAETDRILVVRIVLPRRRDTSHRPPEDRSCRCGMRHAESDEGHAEHGERHQAPHDPVPEQLPFERHRQHVALGDRPPGRQAPNCPEGERIEEPGELDTGEYRRRCRERDHRAEEDRDGADVGRHRAPAQRSDGEEQRRAHECARQGDEEVRFEVGARPERPDKVGGDREPCREHQSDRDQGEEGCIHRERREEAAAEVFVAPDRRGEEEWLEP